MTLPPSYFFYFVCVFAAASQHDLLHACTVQMHRTREANLGEGLDQATNARNQESSTRTSTALHAGHKTL